MKLDFKWKYLLCFIIAHTAFLLGGAVLSPQLPGFVSHRTPSLSLTDFQQFLIVFSSLFFFLFSGSCLGHDQVRLVGDLMKDYNKYVRPVRNSSTTVIVEFQFFFSTVLDMVSAQVVVVFVVNIMDVYNLPKIIDNTLSFSLLMHDINIL